MPLGPCGHGTAPTQMRDSGQLLKVGQAAAAVEGAAEAVELALESAVGPVAAVQPGDARHGTIHIANLRQKRFNRAWWLICFI